MKTFAASILVSLSLISTASFAESWVYDENNPFPENCQCTWSFDK